MQSQGKITLKPAIALLVSFVIMATIFLTRQEYTNLQLIANSKEQAGPTQRILTKEMKIDEYIKCADPMTGPAYFIFNHCYSFDAKTGTIKKIPRYDYLVKLVKDLHNGTENDLVEKSRQMIVSWTVAAYELWAVTYSNNWAGLNLSRKEVFVDDGGKNATPESLHGKILFMYSRLPTHLKHKLDFTSLKITNDTRNNYIKGESANENAGRGGSYTFVLIDEAAFIPRSETIWAAVKQSAQGKIVMVSTPNGMNNVFARIRHDVNSGFKIISILWRLHPERTQAWYDKTIKGMTKLQRARELDLSYSESIAGQVFTFSEEKNTFDWTEDAIKLKWKELRKYGGMDFGMATPTVFLLGFYIDDVLYIADEYLEPGRTASENAEHILATMEYWNFKKKDIVVYGDPAARAVNLSSKTPLFNEYQAAGLNITPGDNSVLSGISRIESMLKTGRLKVHVNCTELITALKNAAYPVDKYDRPTKEDYAHDIYSHPLDALKYMVLTSRPESKIKKNWAQAEPDPADYATGSAPSGEDWEEAEVNDIAA